MILVLKRYSFALAWKSFSTESYIRCEKLEYTVYVEVRALAFQVQYPRFEKTAYAGCVLFPICIKRPVILQTRIIAGNLVMP